MDVRTFATADRPAVAVLIDRTWYMGTLRQWERRDDGWWGNVQWSEAPGDNQLGTFHEDAIRLIEDPPVDVTTHG